MASSAPTKILIYLIRRDLRLTDNPVFHEISRVFQSQSPPPFTHLLPIYVFPAHQIEVSGFIPDAEDAAATPKSPYPEARSKVAGFWRCGPHRAKFLAESVWDLKNTLEQTDSRLVIRAGSLSDVIRDVFRHVEELNDSKAESSASSKSCGEEPKDFKGQTSASQTSHEVIGVWMTRDDGFEEKEEEAAIKEIVERSGRSFRSILDEKYYVHEYGFPLLHHYLLIPSSSQPLFLIPHCHTR